MAGAAAPARQRVLTSWPCVWRLQVEVVEHEKTELQLAMDTLQAQHKSARDGLVEALAKVSRTCLARCTADATAAAGQLLRGL